MTDSNGGTDNADVMRRNVGKSPRSVQARLVEFTNAHRQGCGSVAEESFLAWQAQQAPGYNGKRDILYDSIEAPPNTDILTDEGRRAGLTAAYMDAPWNDIERKSDEMADRRTSVADSIRFYLNGLGAEEDAWVEPMNFDALVAADTVVADREQVAMFVDCSKSGDATGVDADPPLRPVHLGARLLVEASRLGLPQARGMARAAGRGGRRGPRRLGSLLRGLDGRGPVAREGRRRRRALLAGDHRRLAP